MNTPSVSIQQLTKRQIPVFTQSVSALKMALSGSVLNWNTVGSIILKDPGLILETFRLLKGGSKRMASLEVTDMSQAVMLLGVERVRNLVDGLPLLEETLSGDALARFCRASNRAYHAACQARNWAQWRNDFAPEEIFIATQLHGIPELALWVNDPEKMQQLRHRVYKDGMSPDEAHHITLGNSLQHYGRTVTADLELPEFVHDVLRPENAGQTRVQNVLLAVQLSNLAEFGWYTESVSRILEEVAEFVNKSPDDITRIVHSIAVQVANESAFTSVGSVAALLVHTKNCEDELIAEEFPDIAEEKSPKETDTGKTSGHKPENKAGTGSVSLVDGRQTQAASNSPASTPTASKAASVVCLSPQPVLFSEAVIKLERGIGKLGASEIIRCAVHGIHDGAGMHRVVFAAKAPNRNYLEARYLVGSDNDIAFNRFTIKMDKDSLFTRLLEKPSSIWVNDENRSKYWPSVPESFRFLIKTNSFCAMPVHIEGKPIGLFYADRHSPECIIDKKAFTMFRHLCQLAEKSLLARPKKASE